MKSKIILLVSILIFLLSISFFIFNTFIQNQYADKLANFNPPSQKQIIVATETIAMKPGPNAFEPNILTVKKNTKIIFKNEDTVDRWPASDLHPTHGIYPEFDPLQPVQPGTEWSFVFDKVGTWKYHDHLIPSFRGEIRVEE